VSNAGLKEYNMKRRAITFASAAFFVTSLALASDTWILDSSKSNARLFQGSRTNPRVSEHGVARVTEKVKLDTNDLDGSVFDLSFYPADEDWGHVLSPEGPLQTGYVGTPCTGTVVAATRDNNCDVPASAREDYSEPQCTPETSNQTTIVLDIKFLHTVPEPSVEADSGKESSWNAAPGWLIGRSN
jgi:hypothetical protein